MVEYWFYGIFPNTVVKESELTPEQKNIIETESNKINKDNYGDSWLGYSIKNGWRFMRHGLIVEKIKEEKSNVARELLYKKLKEKYGNKNQIVTLD